MAKNNLEGINFQQYVDGVKERKHSWKFFISVMQDLTYHNIHRLKNLNNILLTELTLNYSDIDKLKYLNGILMIQFKNLLQKDCEFEISENDNHEETFEETTKEVLTYDFNDYIIECDESETSNQNENEKENTTFSKLNDFNTNIDSIYEDECEIVHEGKTTRALECNICKKYATSKKELQDHLQDFHGCGAEKGYVTTFPKRAVKAKPVLDRTCETCEKVFKYPYDLKTHIKIVHEKIRDVKCDHCDFRGGTKAHIWLHKKSHHMEIMDLRKAKLFKEENQTKQKEINNTKNQLHECEQCGRMFDSLQRYKIHENHSHVKKQRIPCPLCKKTFKTKANLKGHIAVIHDGQTEICDQCKGEFRGKVGLATHIKSKYKTNKPKYIFYIIKKNLKLFSVVHERRKDWKCDNCSKEFSIRSNLMQHVKRMHGTGEKDHHCNTCGMTFFRGNDLNAHEKR